MNAAEADTRGLTTTTSSGTRFSTLFPRTTRLPSLMLGIAEIVMLRTQKRLGELRNREGFRIAVVGIEIVREMGSNLYARLVALKMVLIGGILERWGAGPREFW